jgi:hypothetical protein
MVRSERNPFEVLRLDPNASEEEIVRRAAQLRRRAGDEATLAELRRAVQALTGRLEDRQLLALLTHPRPGYAAPAFERLAALYRRPPVADEAAESDLSFDFAEFAELFAAALAEEIDAPQLPFEAVAADDGPDEIHLQSAEALWQALVVDGGA